jgi:hypothetical protein
MPRSSSERGAEEKAMKITRILMPSLLSAFALCVPRAALADAASCTTQHASGQREEKSGHLKAAMEQFTSCGSDESCPDAVRTECMDRFASIEKLVPTVVFAVTDASGADYSSVKVYSGDELLVDGLDGRAIQLDPGKHHFRFELASGQKLETEVLVREGERNRVIKVTVPAEPGQAVEPKGPAAPGPATPLTPPPAEEARPIPVGFWIASGVGVAALGSFGVFALLGRSIHSSLADCSPSCNPNRKDDYDTLKRDYLIADISLGAAVVSAGVAATFLFTGSSDSARSTGSLPHQQLRVGFAPASRGVGGTVWLGGESF